MECPHCSEIMENTGPEGNTVYHCPKCGAQYGFGGKGKSDLACLSEPSRHPMKGAFPGLTSPPKPSAEVLLGGIYRVWWITNPPRDGFHVVCASLGSAMSALQMLVSYDLYLEDAVSSNAGGLEVFKDGDWEEWYSEDGDDIMTYMGKGGMI